MQATVQSEKFSLDIVFLLFHLLDKQSFHMFFMGLICEIKLLIQTIF